MSSCKKHVQQVFSSLLMITKFSKKRRKKSFMGLASGMINNFSPRLSLNPDFVKNESDTCITIIRSITSTKEQRKARESSGKRSDFYFDILMVIYLHTWQKPISPIHWCKGQMHLYSQFGAKDAIQ